MLVKNQMHTRQATRRFIVVSICICLAILNITLRSFAKHEVSNSQAGMLRRDEKQGVMTVADHQRLNLIVDRLSKSGQISDSDLDFWIRLLQKGPLVDKGFNRSQFETYVLGDLINIKPSNKLQSEKLFTAVLPYVFDRNANYFHGAEKSPQIGIDMGERLATSNQIFAIDIMIASKNPRAIRVLSNLANITKYQEVRTKALDGMNKLMTHRH